MANPGRPKKHLEQEHHFVADEPEAAEPVAESPIISPTLEETPTEENQFDVARANAISHVTNAPQDYVDDAGWHPIDTFPKNGLPMRVSGISAGDGVLAIWKRTRVFNGKAWTDTGIWIDAQTGVDINFTPKYWKERF